ncbi:hypothetical protein FHW84_000452 [Dyella sp. SG562]|uniref:hypothetical protein n=1 Tax=Dyella marensis TaxID=500610 RepID=UPI001806DA94|nr:hypothetical protein [Dyella sp. SG562]NKJ21345.1 hypothetical protein [Dyella sp. SG609]
MKKDFFKPALLGASLLATLALSGCGTTPAKDFGGSWKQVNRFQDAPTEIPLAKNYTFYASPMDETLKNMLTRWSRDTGMQLSYQLPSDYTLYKRVSDLHTTDIQSATAELSSIYASQGVSVSADERQILVQAAGGSVGAPADAPNSPAPSAPSAK